MSDFEIQRCEHDPENPYTMVSNELIRDENLHPVTRWILIMLLSNKDNWKIRAKQFINLLKIHGIGRDKTLSFFKQACEVGYMKKVAYKEGNLNRCRYIFSEKPKFKKNFPQPSDTTPAPGSSDQAPEQTAYKKEHRSSKEELNKKEQIKTSEIPASSPTTQRSEEMAKYFLEKRKALFPKMKDPVISRWANDLRLMHERDKRSWKEIREAIDFAMEDSFWCRNILSAEKIRLQYDKLYAKMTQVENKGTQEEKCREIARTIKNYLNSSGKNNFQLFKTKCFIGEKNQEVYYNMNPAIFEEILTKAYGLRKK